MLSTQLKEPFRSHCSLDLQLYTVMDGGDQDGDVIHSSQAISSVADLIEPIFSNPANRFITAKSCDSETRTFGVFITSTKQDPFPSLVEILLSFLAAGQTGSTGRTEESGILTMKTACPGKSEEEFVARPFASVLGPRCLSFFAHRKPFFEHNSQASSSSSKTH